MASAAGSVWSRHDTLAKLPVQLLADVLSHVPVEHRLGCCARVCSTWQKAAALGTTSVELGQPTDTNLASLSAWLASHPAKALITSISVQDEYGRQQQLLLLPIQQLQGLQHLFLDSTPWFPPDAPAAALGHAAQQDPTAASESGLLSTAPPDLAALTALTSLTLRGRAVKLAGLQALTGLRDLECCLSLWAPGTAAHAVGKLAAAIPRLQQLRKLRLSGDLAADKALVHVSVLTALQEMHLSGSCWSAASCRALSTTLTSLHLVAPAYNDGWSLSPSSTPGICQLTALRKLKLDCICIDTAILGNLISLQNLSVEYPHMTSAPDVPKMLVLSKLTRLRSLRITVSYEGPFTVLQDLTPPEAAALTASSHLTSLDLSYAACPIPPGAYGCMFAGSCRLPHLRKLTLGLVMANSGWAAQQLAKCCMGVTYLALLDIDAGREVSPTGLRPCMSALLRLKRLAHLVLEVDFLEGRDDYWLQALQRMSALTHLSLTYYFSEPGAADAPQRSEILHLAQCTQLHRLTGGFTGGSRCYWNWNYESQAPLDEPPDVWFQFAQGALKWMFKEDDSDSVMSTMRLLLLSTTHQLQQQQEQLQQQQDELQEQAVGYADIQTQLAAARARVAAADARVAMMGVQLQSNQAQLTALQQQVQTLQASLEAVLGQLEQQR